MKKKTSIQGTDAGTIDTTLIRDTLHTVVHTKPTTDTLLSLLSVRRPHRGIAEFALARAISNLPGGYLLHNLKGKLLAAVVEVGTHSRVLFSAHLDTVHSTDGMQVVHMNDRARVLHKTDGEPLGADDGAGIWLMLHMIYAGVPGVYTFPVGEECGGVGSKGLALEYEDFLKGFDHAIAFDRRGTYSVITHQGCTRCCSDEFAETLSSALTAAMSDSHFMSPDDTGVYTDTAEYTRIIPECTNISIGYANEHTGSEVLDVQYVMSLASACVRMDWANLPVKRDPAQVEKDEDDYWYESYKYTYTSPNAFYDDAPMYFDDEVIVYAQDLVGMSEQELVEFARVSSPTLIGGLLYDMLEMLQVEQ